mgnify:CR=1 FL=1
MCINLWLDMNIGLIVLRYYEFCRKCFVGYNGITITPKLQLRKQAKLLIYELYLKHVEILY